ncbi:hypothetical protein V6615_05700 [Oscillospiraceae bacterium PP1C4]
MNYAADSLVFTALDMNEAPVHLPCPLEFEVVKSFDSPAHSFEGIFPCTRAYPELFQISVFAGSTKIFDGMIDEQSVTENDQGRQIKLLARSVGAVLLDNEALPQLYQSVSLTQIFNNHIRPYGYHSLVADTDPSFDRYQILKGVSEWEAFSNFFRNTAHGNAFIDENNNVVCRTKEPVGTIHTFSNREISAQHYTNLKITNNRYSPITRFVIRDNNGAYSYAYDNKLTNELRLKRRRYLVPSVEYTLSSNGGSIDAALRIRRSMLGKLVITLTCPEMLVSGVCDRVNLDTGLEQYKNLFVQQVRYKLAASGVTTTLTLLNNDYV